MLLKLLKIRQRVVSEAAGSVSVQQASSSTPHPTTARASLSTLRPRSLTVSHTRISHTLLAPESTLARAHAHQHSPLSPACLTTTRQPTPRSLLHTPLRRGTRSPIARPSALLSPLHTPTAESHPPSTHPLPAARLTNPRSALASHSLPYASSPRVVVVVSTTYLGDDSSSSARPLLLHTNTIEAACCPRLSTPARLHPARVILLPPHQPHSTKADLPRTFTAHTQHHIFAAHV